MGGQKSRGEFSVRLVEKCVAFSLEMVNKPSLVINEKEYVLENDTKIFLAKNQKDLLSVIQDKSLLLQITGYFHK